jgi:hypothetical protein
VFREGEVDGHHFDPYSQALSKVERGFTHDLEHVRAMIAHGLVDLSRAIESELYRYPAIDPPAFARRLRQTIG